MSNFDEIEMYANKNGINLSNEDISSLLSLALEFQIDIETTCNIFCKESSVTKNRLLEMFDQDASDKDSTKD